MSEAGGERGRAGEEPRECWPGRSAHPGPRQRGGGGRRRAAANGEAALWRGRAGTPGPRLPRPLTAKLTNSALAPAGAGSPEPGPDQRAWQQRVRRLAPGRGRRCSAVPHPRPAPSSLLLSQACRWPPGLFPFGAAGSEDWDPHPRSLAGPVEACACDSPAAVNYARGEGGPRLRRRTGRARDRPAMERPRRGARNRPALPRGSRLSPGSAGLPGPLASRRGACRRLWEGPEPRVADTAAVTELGTPSPLLLQLGAFAAPRRPARCTVAGAPRRAGCQTV